MSDNWQDQAACRKHDPEMWFGKDERRAVAQAICLTCPVAAECLRHALDMGEVDGVWGGLSPTGRQMWRNRNVSNAKS